MTSNSAFTSIPATPDTDAHPVPVLDPAKVSRVPPAQPPLQTPSPLKVLFAHGKQGGPDDHTASFLFSRFDCLVPRMPTGDLDVCLRMHEDAIKEFKPDVVVGESLGGWVEYQLIKRGVWNGPTVWLAPAVQKVEEEFNGFEQPKIPEHFGGPLLIIHGTRDDIVPIQDSCALTATAKCETKLIEVGDDHSMRKAVDSGELGEWIEWVARMEQGSPEARKGSFQKGEEVVSREGG